MTRDPYRLVIGQDGVGRYAYDHDAGRAIAADIERREREAAAKRGLFRRLRERLAA